jgi:uroporphyrinogen III methyltransferase/synthase
VSGRVYIVGAGPGDPGLLTARAIELIAAADVILYDRLVGDQALAGARSDAEVLYVGKAAGGPSMAQADTEALMQDRARAGKIVVRLKGGDPFVFGRGGEEGLALRAAGIEFEVVPGITAGIAAATYAGIPVTQRGVSSAVALVTAHEDPAKQEQTLDWQALGAFPGTLVFYMGVRHLGELAKRLIAAGRPPDQPAALVERGTLPEQRTIHATLETLAAQAAEHDVGAPAVTIVGEVCRLASALDWLGRGPLAGKTVAVTRAREQAGSLARRLRSLGARVLETPVIRIVPRTVTLPPMQTFDLLCLTSANGVALLFERLHEQGLDTRALAGLRVCAIGPGTAAALSAHGVVADIVPERFVAEGLIEALASLDVRHALIATAADARETLVDALRARGVEVTVIALYDTVAEPLSPTALAALAQADYLTFTSASTARFLLDSATPASHTRLASIGPVTSATLRERGIEPHVEAARHDIQGLLDALVGDVAATTGAS